MNIPINLVAEQPKQLTGREECALLQRAMAQRETPAIRLKLAQLHYRLDEFDNAIALLNRAHPPVDYVTANTLAAALLGRGKAEDFEPALTAARAAEALADCDLRRAAALVDQARVRIKTGKSAQAASVLSAALELDPANGDALRLLSGQLLARNEPEQVQALCDDCEVKGAAHVQLLGIQSQALAQRGEIQAARELAGLDHFLFQSAPLAPDGWTDLPSFHAALTQELLASAGMRNGRHGTASIASLRVDEPATATTPAMRALQQLIIDYARNVVDMLPGQGHPWLRRRPDAAHLRMWSVITGSEGYERWHMHPMGWASGGYYVEVPETVRRGDSPAGCLEFGMPDHPIGREVAEAFGSRLVRPHAGLLNLFPSHAYHRTHPHGAHGVRICIAFDLIPD